MIKLNQHAIVMTKSLRSLIRAIICFWMIGSLVINVCAQDVPDCRKVFDKAYQHFKIPGNSGYAMTYSMKSILVSGQSSEEGVHVLFKDNRAYVETKHSKVYKDDLVTVMIDDSEKLIFIGRVAKGSGRETQFDQMAMLQDSLLNHGSEFECRAMVSEDDKPYAMITVRPNADMKLASGYEELRYHIDQESEKIVEIEVDYTPDHPQLREVRVSFSRYDKDFEGKVFEGMALAQVYDEHGELRELYTEYQVINNLTNQETK